MRKPSALRLDLVEVACLVALASACTFVLRRPAPPPRVSYVDAVALQELDRLRTSYGPQHYTERAEEWIIRDFFKDRRDGVFVDVGANHYRNASTTYFLEERLGWSGIAVEPQASFEADYRKYRPRTRFFPLFASDASNQTARLYMNDVSLVASGQADFTRQFGTRLRETQAPTIALSDLLDTLKMAHLDLLSIDVELSEPRVLAGFDIDRFQPSFVCIEAHPAVRQQILDYFAHHHYVLAGAYLRVDPQNLYFKPLN